MIKNRTLIIIFLAAAAVCAAVIVLSRSAAQNAGYAEIVQGGEVIETVPLAEAENAVEIRVGSEDGGYNTVRIDSGGAQVTEADCPDKVCVEQGRITDGTYPIVCLPHKLVVRLVTKPQSGIDAVTGR